jgi:dTDP-D-glucose 4,6-dehydratase
MTALAWAHTRRVRVIVKKGDVRVTMYFSGHERASGVEVLMAIVEAIEDAKRDPMTRDLDKTIEDHEIQKDTDFSDVEKVIK